MEKLRVGSIGKMYHYRSVGKGSCICICPYIILFDIDGHSEYYKSRYGKDKRWDKIR